MDATDEPMFAVSPRIEDGLMIIETVGELDYQLAPLLHEQISRALDSAKIFALIMDVSRVTFWDSSGLATVVQILSRCQELDVQFHLSGVDQRLRHRLAIVGVEDLLSTYESLADALRTVRPGVE